MTNIIFSTTVPFSKFLDPALKINIYFYISRNLFKPVHKERSSSHMYKGLVDCKVLIAVNSGQSEGHNDNSSQSANEGSHYLQ